ncbi:unnamed protein product, partial [Coregonus sp. 'balchen']
MEEQIGLGSCSHANSHQEESSRECPRLSISCADSPPPTFLLSIHPPPSFSPPSFSPPSHVLLRVAVAQRNDRESIRQKLALGSFYDDEEPVIYNSCSKNGLPSRPQSGVNLQVCFVNDSSSDKDSDAEDSKTETSLDTPLSPVVHTVDSKQSSSLSDRDTGEEDSDPLEECGFWRVQRRLQEEARVALALARPMARMQVEVERQIQLHRRSPVADL